MSTLSGQTIQSTYPGLIKLADSTNGLTGSFQSLQDGLGNNLNMEAKNGALNSSSFVATNIPKPDYAGAGVGTAAAGGSYTNTQNRILYSQFFELGSYSYSSLTYNITTLTSSSDVVDLSFYTTQFVPGYGLAPKDLIMSGISLDVSSTGFKSVTLPSTLSFSAYGQSIFTYVFRISNAGVAPTVRIGGAVQGQTALSMIAFFSGFVQSPVDNSIIAPFRNNPGNMGVLNLPNLQTSFSESDVSSNFEITTLTRFGFALKTI